MPYIVTTKRPKPGREFESLNGVIFSRCAVATLDEARDVVTAKGTEWYRGMDDDLWLASLVRSISKDGGSVGPLPDGTVIEVEAVGWRFIEDATGHHLGHPGGKQGAIDAFNARQVSDMTPNYSYIAGYVRDLPENDPRYITFLYLRCVQPSIMSQYVRFDGRTWKVWITGKYETIEV